MLKELAVAAFCIVGFYAFFLSGAWFGETRKGSVAMIVVAVLLVLAALAFSGCAAKALYHACREGLCR